MATFQPSPQDGVTLVVQFVFYLVAFLGACYFLFYKRRFDFFTIGFASSLLYFLPGFFGYVRSSRDFAVGEPLLPATYAVFVMVLACILVGAMLFDHLDPGRPARPMRPIPLFMTTEFAAVVAALALIATLFAYGGALFAQQKADVLAGIGRWHLLYRFAAMFAVVFATIRRQTAWAVVAFGLLLFDFFVGFRFGVVITVIAVAVVVLNRKGPQSLLGSEFRSMTMGLVVVGLVLVYKHIYVFVKLGLWDIVAQRLSSPRILQLAVLNSEPFTTQSILNEIIAADLHTGGEHLKYLGNLLVPFATMLGAQSQSFNDLFQQQLFGGVSGGLANNIWAEMYAVGGWLAIGIAVALYVLLLAIGSRLLMTARGAGLCLTVIVFTMIAFYIHRNDVGFELTLIRRCLFIWLLIVVPAMLLVDVAAAVRRQQPGDISSQAP